MNIALLPTVDEAAKVFSNQLVSVARKCMPVKEITVCQPDAPWIMFSQSIKRLIQRKN